MGSLQFQVDLVRLMNSSRSSPGHNLDCITSQLVCLMWPVILSHYRPSYSMPPERVSFRGFTCHCSCSKTTLIFCWITLLTIACQTLRLNGPNFRLNGRR